MDSYEPNTHSFVVKIWREESEPEDACTTWRGHITHVVSGERRYLQSLGEVTAFIETYLARMGVARPGETDAGSWLARLRRLRNRDPNDPDQAT
jgi:hypothetical protein